MKVRFSTYLAASIGIAIAGGNAAADDPSVLHATFHWRYLVGTRCGWDLGQDFLKKYRDLALIEPSAHVKGMKDAEEQNQRMLDAFGTSYCSQVKGAFDVYGKD